MHWRLNNVLAKKWRSKMMKKNVYPDFLLVNGEEGDHKMNYVSEKKNGEANEQLIRHWCVIVFAGTEVACYTLLARTMTSACPVNAKLLPHFSQDRVREAHRLRLPRHHLLQREESVAVRVPRMVQGRAGVSGRRVLVRCESLGADAGHSLPAAERNGRHESGCAASEGGQYVLHDETANQIW